MLNSESDPERPIEVCMVNFWIALLDHRLGDDDFASPIVSGLAVLSLRPDGGFTTAEDYTPKFCTPDARAEKGENESGQ
ncbi:hypothetical protein LPUS_09366 [Lasallia pustulata]|uniref:Uncharacterized protein n=1 Tax=Lasallia pustulata TaxID=136370 RepID=A0A1W5D777_9LECA|nr:hypothetical protein LPUS_09366 [Lasallia pustulata]